jgi:hypothetical protein
MKVNVVKDSGGKVVATFEKPAPGGPQIAPQLKPGHTVHEVDASDDYQRNLKTFYEHHSK